MERAKWKKWWAIPLALVLTEVAGYWFFLFIVDFLRGPQFEPMPPAEADQFVALVGNCRLAFSVLLLVVITLVLRRFCDRAQLLRSAAVMAAYQAAMAVITRIVPFSPVLMYLGLPWGPLTNITSTLTLWLGRDSKLIGPFAMVLSISAPFIFVPFGKKKS